MGQQGAQEHHGCRRRLSAEALRTIALRERGSHSGTVDCVALGPVPSPASGGTNADLPAQ